MNQTAKPASNMENRDYTPPEAVEVKRKAVAFQTAQGSIYKVDEVGRTTRYKTVEGKEYKPSGVTVYLNDKFHPFVSSLTYNHDDAKVNLLELRDGALTRIKDIDEVQDKNAVKLAFIDIENPSKFIQLRNSSGELQPAIFDVSFEPELGLHPFEIAYDDQNKKTYHYGNQITDIKHSE
ncbi:MAG TPA: hypothetical protein PKD79_01695 [Candidatus Doudnabacteria bacterium]|nr:hypothetical protein [Candidatus Doudnabacteria bacterium]